MWEKVTISLPEKEESNKPTTFIETILPNLPIDIRSNSFDQIIDASRIKVLQER
ncbi:hypothetical protein M1N65_00665 [Thermodesulfovibrionales bacterium]|nr:hypothetical protein [Thermodesulfovibrionales bacterium]